MRNSEINRIAGELLTLLDTVQEKKRGAVSVETAEVFHRDRSASSPAQGAGIRTAASGSFPDTERYAGLLASDTMLAKFPMSEDTIHETGELLRMAGRDGGGNLMQSTSEWAGAAPALRSRRLIAAQNGEEAPQNAAEFAEALCGMMEDTVSMEAVDNYFRRDSRRYDSGFDTD